jgi:hypothetical protein
LSLVALGWLIYVAQFEGKQWPNDRLNSWLQVWQIAVWLVASSTIVVWGMRIISERHNRSSQAAFLIMVVATVLLAVRFDWAKWSQSPDWLSILTALLAGMSAGAIYVLRPPPDRQLLWPLAAPFVVIAVIAAVRSGSSGDLIGLVALLLLADALGRRIGRYLAGQQETDSAPVSFPWFLRAGLGLAALIFLFRLIGLTGGAGQISILAVTASLIIWLRQEVVDGLGDTRQYLQKRVSLHPSEGILVGLSLSLGLIFWLSALAPETGPDALGARSALPMLWADWGDIRGVPEIAASYMGGGGEVLNLILLPFSGENCAKIATYATGLLLFGAFIWIAHGHLRSGLLGGLLFFSSTTVWWHFCHGFVDIPLTFFCVATLGMTLLWRITPIASWLGAVGLLGGTAAAIKLNGGAILASLLPVIVVLAWSRATSKRNFVLQGVWLATGASVAMAASVIRSQWLTGNPVFPFANGFFKSPLAELELTARLYGSGIGLQTLSLPFVTVLRPASFSELGTYHPLVWLFVVIALCLIRRQSNEAKLTWIVTGLMGFFWAITEQNLRYSLPAFGCLMAAAIGGLASVGTSNIFRGSWWLSLNIVFLLLLGIGINLTRPTAWMWTTPSGPPYPIRFAFGHETAAEFRNLRLRSATLAEYVNASDGSKAVIWEVPWMRDHLSFQGRTVAHPHGDPRILHPLRDLLPDRNSGKDPVAIFETLTGLGFTHLIWDDNNPWCSTTPEPMWEGLFSTSFSENYLTLEAADRGLRLYRIRTTYGDFDRGAFEQTPISTSSIIIHPHNLLGIQFEWDSPVPEGAFIDLAYYSSEGQLLLFDRTPLSSAPSGFQRRWQSIPAGATSLSLNPSVPLPDVKMHQLRTRINQ